MGTVAGEFELEGAELLVDYLPHYFVGGHVGEQGAVGVVYLRNSEVEVDLAKSSKSWRSGLPKLAVFFGLKS